MDNDRLQRRMDAIKLIPYSSEYRDQAMQIGRQMHADSIYRDLPFDENKTEKQLALCNIDVPERYFKLAIRDGEVLGGMLGCVKRSFFCDELFASDMGWWVAESHRGSCAALKLLDDFVEWAQSKGARKVMVGQSTGRNIEQTTKLYQHCGFRIIGYNTVKDI